MLQGNVSAFNADLRTKEEEGALPRRFGERSYPHHKLGGEKPGPVVLSRWSRRLFEGLDLRVDEDVDVKVARMPKRSVYDLSMVTAASRSTGLLGTYMQTCKSQGNGVCSRWESDVQERQWPKSRIKGIMQSEIWRV